MTIEQRIEEPVDQFPVGMRVLAVDDDPTCLQILERLLRKCKYHVTTRTHAIAALNLLRENKNRFDLVISDVHMPDMDGFKLLELVGLEMDLPVIMLSANGDPKLVMKGITHGACDYLLKPVRIEELQIIWQHVVRKKKVDPKDQKPSENGHYGSSDGAQGAGGNGNADQKSNRKRKDQIEDEDEDRDENEFDDDPSAQKKPRVVWSIELHRKFVSAVNHLGIDKAVPKRILELMNVEKLTRENVASHLQKYRLYLKRISCVQSQQANMITAFGNTDPSSYMRISSLNGMGGFNSLSSPPQFQNAAAFRSFPHSGMLGRLNSSASHGIQRLPSPAVNHSQMSGYTGHTADQGSTLLPRNPNGCILKGMPVPFEFHQLQDSNTSVSHVEELPTKVNDLTVFPVSSGLLNAKAAVGGLKSCHLSVPNNTLMLQGHPVQTHSRIGNQQSAMASLSSDLPSHFTDQARGDGNNWPVAVQSSAVQSNSYASYLGGCQHMNTHLDNESSISQLPLSVADYQFSGAPSSVGQDRKQSWDDFATSAMHSSHIMANTINNSSNTGHGMTAAAASYGQVNAQRIPDVIEEPNYADTLRPIQHREPSTLKQAYYSQGKPQAQNVGSLEDLVSSMMK